MNFAFPKKSILTSLLTTCYLLLATNVPQAEAWKSSTDGSQPATFQDLESVFSNILGIIVAVGGTAVFVMFLIGGFKFMFSGGDPQKSAAARATITWSIIGFLALLGSWFILRFIQEFTGADVTTFKIPS